MRNLLSALTGLRSFVLGGGLRSHCTVTVTQFFGNADTALQRTFLEGKHGGVSREEKAAVASGGAEI